MKDKVKQHFRNINEKGKPTASSQKQTQDGQGRAVHRNERDERVIIFRVFVGKIPDVFFPPWWAVPVLTEITAEFGSTGNRRSRYRRKIEYRYP